MERCKPKREISDTEVKERRGKGLSFFEISYKNLLYVSLTRGRPISMKKMKIAIIFSSCFPGRNRQTN